MDANVSQIVKMLPFLVPILILEVVLLVVAILDIVKRQKVTGGNKVLWIVVVVIFQIIGPIVYFIFGRKESDVDGN